MQITAKFIHEKTTPGTYRYAETDKNGEQRERGDPETMIGTVYLKKQLFKGDEPPLRIEVAVDY